MKLYSETIKLPSSCLQAEAEYTAYLSEPLEDGKGGTLPRPAVIICPGGGYEHWSKREGEAVALRFLSMGCHAFVLHYSLAPVRFPAALQELALLVSKIRSRAVEWAVDPERILVFGFSAGGHLAGSLGVFWNHELVYNPLGLKPGDIRPDGLILCYPVITAGKHCHRASFERLLGDRSEDPAMRELLSLEKQAGPHTPRTFLWHTATDGTVPVENSLLFASALARHQVGLELHIYPEGCHGLSMAGRETSGGLEKYIEPHCQSWVGLAERWLEKYYF